MNRSAALLLTASLTLAACEKAATPPADAAPSSIEAITAAGIEGDASSAWTALTGAWAQPGACGDVRERWLIEADAFHLHETHCPVLGLQLLQNGVRVRSHCSTEGDDDRVEDVFTFDRRPDATLTIVNEANGAATAGLKLCGAAGSEI